MVLKQLQIILHLPLLIVYYMDLRIRSRRHSFKVCF